MPVMKHQRPGIATPYVLVALIVAAAGAGLFIQQILGARETVRTMLEGFERIEVPGEIELDLEQSGVWTIYLEHPPTDAREVRVRPDSLVCTVTRLDSGEPLEVTDLLAGEPTVDPSLFARGLADPESSVPDVYVYKQGERSGFAAWQFAVDEPTRVRIETTLDENEALTRPLTLAIGTGSFRDVLSGWSGLYGGAAVLTITFTAATMLLVIGYMRSARSVTPRSEMPEPSGDRA